MVKERRILDREPKKIPGMDEEKEKPDKEKKDRLQEEIDIEIDKIKKKRERKPRPGEPDYEWCEEEVLPDIDVTFDEEEEIISEKTSHGKVII